MGKCVRMYFFWIVVFSEFDRSKDALKHRFFGGFRPFPNKPQKPQFWRFFQ